MVVGSGNAGLRHIEAVRRALPNAEVVVVRRPNSHSPIENLAALDVAIVRSVEDALVSDVTLGVVASPAPFHREAAVQLAAAGAHVLVEKPLAATSTEARSLVGSVASSGVGLVVGYNLRCSDVTVALARALGDGAIGAPSRFSFDVGQHLSQWRPGVDPRESVTARKDLGGGVLLELSHEFDALRFLLGDVEYVIQASVGFDGAPTDGLVETRVDATLSLVSGVVGSVHLDMTSEVSFRRWLIEGDQGATLEADHLAGVVRLLRPSMEPEVLTNVRPGDRDRSEDLLVRNLIGVAHAAEKPLCVGEDGIAALVIAEAVRQAASSGSAVAVDAQRGGPV